MEHLFLDVWDKQDLTIVYSPVSSDIVSYTFPFAHRVPTTATSVLNLDQTVPSFQVFVLAVSFLWGDLFWYVYG